MPLVFQYGSNMSSVRLNGADRLRGHATIIGVAETQDIFQLVFDIFSGGNNQCAAANLVSGSGRRIWGVLYEVPAEFIARDPKRLRPSLDAIEGEGKNYGRVHINLRHANGDPVVGQIITYLGIARKTGILTSLDYVGHILMGLAEHPEIPGNYVEYVRACILTNNPALRIPA